MAIVKKIVVGTPLRPVRIIGASVDSSSVRRLIDSAYINSHLDDTLFLDSAEAISLIDSAYIQARQAVNTTDSATITNIIDSAYVNAKLDTTLFLDSSEATALIDSAYILARASNIQNLRDSGSDTIITGALLPATDSAQDLGSPTRKFKDLYLSGSTLYIGNVAIGADSDNNVKIFTLDGAGNIQSTRGKVALLDAADSDDDILSKVDSAYVNARLDTTLFLDSSEVIQLVDSNYVASRTFTQTQIEDFARAVSLDSAETIALIDSAYVLARGIQNIVDSGSDLVISGSIIPDTDSAYSLGSADKKFTELYLSGNTIFLGGNTISVDSSNDFRIRNSAGLLANLVADHLHLGTDKKKLSVDANDRLQFTTDNLATNYGFNLEANSITDLSDVDSGAVAGQFLRWNGTQFVPFDVDSAYVAARTWTQPDIEAFARDVSLDSAEAKVLIDSAVNALVDGAPAALDTLNELAAALNDDSNAYGSLTALINSKLTSTQFDTLFDSALGTKTTDDVTEGVNNLYYTDTRVETFVDSAYINSRLNADLFLDSSEVLTLIDSDYITARASTFDSASALALIDSAYIEARQSSENLTLGTVTDGSLTDGAIQTLTPDTKIVDAIDELNEAMLNVSNNTFVRSVNFSGSPLAGGEGVSVTLSINPDGNANRYDVNWGDGTIDSAITDPTPTHTYASNSGSPFNVTVRAFNNTGTGSGSSASFERISYIIVYTADPVANFAAYAAPTGGPALSFWQDGDTVYFENTTSNTTMANVTYRWTWGDGTQEDVDSDNAPGGVLGPRIPHTFALSTETDVQRSPNLQILTHTTADPTVIDDPVQRTRQYEILDSHSPSLSLTGDAFGVNAEATSGLTKTFTNTSEAGIGSYSTYGNQYRWSWGDGSSNQIVNAGSSSAGDRNRTINHTFNLPDSDQINGHVRDYNTELSLLSNHVSSPFVSPSQTITLVPEVRAEISSGQAVVISDASGDNQYDIYDGIDYQNNDRLAVQVTPNSQHADSAHTFTWKSGDTPFPVTNNIANNHTFDSADHTDGDTIVSTLTATGTLYPDPGVGSQTDTETISWTYHDYPSPAPNTIAGQSLEFQTTSEGTNPKLCHNVPNSSGLGITISGLTLDGNYDAAFSMSGIRKITSGNISTNEISNFLIPSKPSTNRGLIKGELNLGNDFSDVSTTGGYGTSGYGTGFTGFGSQNKLRVTQNRDYHEVNSSYPSGFYRVASAKIENVSVFSDLSSGMNFLEILTQNGIAGSAYEGNPPDGEITSARAFALRDNISDGASFNHSAATLANGLLPLDAPAGYRYIGGIPYYKDGNIKLINNRMWRVTTYAYLGDNDPIQITRNNNLEGTSGAGIDNVTYSYTDILDASDIYNSAQAGPVPRASLGSAGTAYNINDLTIPITSSFVRCVEDGIIVTHKNVNGSFSLTLDKPIRVYTNNTIIGIDETDITSTVPNKNGNGVRVTGFASGSGDTPSYNGSTNFYTTNAISHSVDPNFTSTQEAGVSINGLIQHDITNYNGHLPSGPDRRGDTGDQYFTFAFRSTALQNFNINLTTSTGISGLYIALPGTGIDTSSTLNGWLDCSATYNGSGQPGAGTGGNGSNGCAFGGEAVPTGSAINNQSYSMTFGTLSAAGSTGNNVLVRVVLASGETVSDISVSQFS